MSRLHGKTAVAALALVLGLGIGHSYAITIDGGTSAVVDGWNITPDVGVTLDAEAVTGGVVIAKTVTFTSNSGLGVSFQQTGIAPKQVQFVPETITNSTGSDWTGFQFTLTGAATVSGVSDVFAPPFGTGVNYTSVSLNPEQTQVTYMGSQVNGTTSTWGDVTTGDSLLIIGDATASAPFASFKLEETPMAASSAVPVPSPLWLSAVGLLTLGLIPSVRKAAVKAQA